MEYPTESSHFMSPGKVSKDMADLDLVEIAYHSSFFFHRVAPGAWQQHIAAQTGDRKPESKYMSHRHRRHVSCGSHGTHMLDLECQHDPVRLTEHLRGTHKSEAQKKKGSVAYLASLQAAKCRTPSPPVIGFVFTHRDVLSCVPLIPKENSISPHPPHFPVSFRGAVWVYVVPPLLLVVTRDAPLLLVVTRDAPLLLVVTRDGLGFFCHLCCILEFLSPFARGDAQFGW